MTSFSSGRICNDGFIANFLMSVSVKKVVKIGQYLTKICAKVWCLVFLIHRWSSYGSAAFAHSKRTTVATCTYSYRIMQDIKGEFINACWRNVEQF